MAVYKLASQQADDGDRTSKQEEFSVRTDQRRTDLTMVSTERVDWIVGARSEILFRNSASTYSGASSATTAELMLVIEEESLCLDWRCNTILCAKKCMFLGGSIV